jgi:hypothetical protein
MRWLLLLGAPILCAQTAAIATQEKFQLDGRLLEPFWKQAQVIPLTQQAPKPGEPTPFETTVRIATTPDAVYVAFVCRDPDPSALAVHTMQRDGDTDADDFVAVALDTYGDRRTGYFFRVNAAGARVDGLIAGAEHPSYDWDGIWDARTQRGADGWTVEIVIPSRTLSFKKGLDTWGANFERNVARVRTVLRWSSPTLDSFFYDLSRSAAISGFGQLQQGLGLEFIPYATGRVRNEFQTDGRAMQASVGGDFTYRITSQLAAVFTANTDFAETEVDTRQLNLSRFELFFPERRTFFLEGSNQYQFGLGLDAQFIPFFSRRIGLFEGEQIPINAGVKLNGRVGKWNVGLLDVQTRDRVLRDGSLVRGTNLFASRVSYDVTPKLRLGGIVTNGNPDGATRNRLAGFDGVWRTSEFRGNKNLFIGGWAAVAGGDVGQGDRNGYGFKIDYPNDRWDCFVSFNKYGSSLAPALGYLPRPGVHRFETACEFRPRPRKDGPFAWVRQQFMEQRFYRVTNERGQVESQQFSWTPVNIQTETGDRFSINWIPWYEYLPVPFAIAESATLPVGEYRFQRLLAEFESSPNRRMQFTNTTGGGSFYNGTLYQQENSILYTSHKGSWQAGVTIEQNFGKLKQGRFVQRLWQLQTTYAFNPNLALTSFLQYDTESNGVGNNLRLRWTLKPGNELFVVWNRGWKRLILSPHELGLIPETELLAVKLRWTLRL